MKKKKKKKRKTQNSSCENYNVLQLYYNAAITGQPGDGG